MKKRSEDALQLKQSPLAFVLTQIRFPKFLHMDKHVADIQESFRGKGLSRFSTQQTQQLVFGPEPMQSSYTRWVFSDRAREQAVVLANDFFVFEVSRYDSFDDYMDRMLDLFSVVRDAAELPFSEQIGIRYIDLLRGSERLSPREMVCESLRGLNAQSLGMEDSHYQFVIQGKTPHGNLTIRSFENSGKQFMPPDLQTEHLHFQDTPREDEVYRVIDFDHIFRGELDFTNEGLAEKLWGLHDHTDIAFRQIVTPEAIEHWKRDES